MATEITDITDVKGFVFYDANCRFCVRLAHRVEPWLAGRRFRLLPLQTPGCGHKMGLTDAELMAEMRLLLPDGKYFGGADALLELSRHFWWAWPIRQMAHLPLVLKLFRASYRWVARLRGCADGTCSVATTGDLQAVNLHKPRITALLPLLVLPLIPLHFQTRFAPWVFMWAMAFALYAGCKWLTFCEAARRGLKPGLRRSIAYLLAWPGMDAEDFLNCQIVPVSPRLLEWIFAASKAMLGAILLWGVARMALSNHPSVAGWIGMTGAILVLHFGTFHLLCLAWQQAGVKTTPLMDKPMLSQSLAEFWSRRWNTAFNSLAFRYTFRPLKRRTSPALAVLLVFGLSGLIHELVISLPAHGGYGLPTGYFLIQGLGMLAERNPLGKAIGLGRGLRGWLFTLLIAAGPVFWLFHPPFIKNVILPMLTAIGAT